MDTKALIEECNKYFNQGLRLKDDARKSNSNIEVFLAAADSCSKAAKIHKDLQEQDLPFEDLFQSKVFYFYYKHEEYDCLYGYEIKKNLEKAKQYIVESYSNIVSAVETVEVNLSKLNGDLKERFTKMLVDWKYRQISTSAKAIEPDAKMNSRKKNFIEALDCYKKMVRIYKEAYDYSLNSNLDEVYIRISEGNYYGLFVNISQMYAGYINQLQINEISQIDLDNDLLKYFIDSYRYSIIAFNSNPEWLEYREGQEIMKNNIKLILKDNKKKWLSFLIGLNNDELLIKIMKETDIDSFKKIAAKQEIENDKLKKLFFTGGFYILILLIVFGIIFFVFNSSIPILYKLLAVLFMIVLFSIVGAFILRSTDSLSEENFIKLMRLSLKIGAKGLNSLDDNNKK
ncbi:MAG: hypothetical protein HXX16_17905 [Bacteroidales bacterium]|nr:hypothetical protein [Bacteroidales bacterium]